MNGQEYCDPFEDPSCFEWFNGGLLPPVYPIGKPSRFCRSKSQPWIYAMWPGNLDCPEGFAPTTFGSPETCPACPTCPDPICPDSDCQLGTVGGYCTEFWILLALAGFVIWKGKLF